MYNIFQKLLNIDFKTLTNVSLIKQKDSVFYQCQFTSNEDEDGKRKGTTVFVNDKTNTIVDNKQIEYAHFLAKKFAVILASPNANCCEVSDNATSELSGAKLLKSSILTEFDNREYGFVNKRLPVVKLEFDTKNHIAFYIDTFASHLAAKISDSERSEGLSFAFFHKFLYMDWAGKTIRDLFSVIIALSIAVVSLLGLRLFLKRK